MSVFDVILDRSRQELEVVPEEILRMYNAKMLYLEGNCLNSLPGNFFERLTRLTWLDLRKNKLKTIPCSIANHSFLETLLLQDNDIEELPNEIGLVPNLKVLQLSGNPLRYPPPNVLEEGVQAICAYLKQEHQKAQESLSAQTDDEEDKESSTDRRTSGASKSSEKITVRELLRRSSSKLRGVSKMPVIDVKGLSAVPPDEGSKRKESKPSVDTIKRTLPEKTHKVTTGPSKWALHSHSKWNTPLKENMDRAQENELKDLWLQRLKELLQDQERIIQQEKNLQALSKWRLEKKVEALRTHFEKLPEPPFGIDPEADFIMSRKDLAIQMNEKKKKIRRKPPEKVDIQQLISQVVEEMQSMENKYNSASPRSPRTEQALAAQQIQNIVELHKKIMKLQDTNTVV